MTTREAKQISIISFLLDHGIKIEKQNNVDTWFLSPLHVEQTASFKVSNAKNLWYDHAQGVGGNILDLVMQINNCDLSGALKILDNNTSFSFSPVESLAAKVEIINNFEIVKVGDLCNSALIKYLESRKINITIAKKYVSEIYFKKKNDNKNLFAIAFKNDKQGYETRNSLYKGNIGGKAISTIKGKGNGKISLFEGVMDFLSVLTRYEMLEITDDIIILNSLSMIENTKELLQKYKEVKYFLDNDKAGNEATKDLLETVGGIDKSSLYAGYKDANDWLLGIKIK